jgi:hypothetical protein
MPADSMPDDDYTSSVPSAWRDHAAGLSSGGLGGEGGGSGKHRNPRFSWTSQYEATFFQSLVESVHLGLRDGSTFKSEAWDRAGNAILERHHAYANKGHLVNKSDNARKKYRLWRGLRENTEFMYNPATHMVTGTDDAWRRHIQVRYCWESWTRPRLKTNCRNRKSRFRDPSKVDRSSMRSSTRYSSPTSLAQEAHRND